MKLEVLFSLLSLCFAAEKDAVYQSSNRDVITHRRLTGDTSVRAISGEDAFMTEIAKRGITVKEVYFSDFLDGEQERVLEKGANDLGPFTVSVNSLWANNTVIQKGSVAGIDMVYKKKVLDVKMAEFGDDGVAYAFGFYAEAEIYKPEKPDKPVPSRGVPDDDKDNLMIVVGDSKFSVNKLLKKDSFMGFISKKGFKSVYFEMRTDRGPAYKIETYFIFTSTGKSISATPTTKLTSWPTGTLAPTKTKSPTVSPTVAPPTTIEIIAEMFTLAGELILAFDWAGASEQATDGFNELMEFIASDEFQGGVDTVVGLIKGVFESLFGDDEAEADADAE